MILNLNLDFIILNLKTKLKKVITFKKSINKCYGINFEYNNKKFAPYNKERFQNIYNDYLNTFQKK